MGQSSLVGGGEGPGLLLGGGRTAPRLACRAQARPPGLQDALSPASDAGGGGPERAWEHRSLLGSSPRVRCVLLTLLPSCVHRGPSALLELPESPAFPGDRGGTCRHRRGPQGALSTCGSWDRVCLCGSAGTCPGAPGERRFHRHRGAGGPWNSRRRPLSSPSPLPPGATPTSKA